MINMVFSLELNSRIALLGPSQTQAGGYTLISRQPPPTMDVKRVCDKRDG